MERKRKLKCLSISEKIYLIREVERGLKRKKDIAIDYGIPANTLSTILKNRDVIVAAEDTNDHHSRKRLKESPFPNLDKAMIQWSYYARNQNIPISGGILLQKSEEFARLLHYDNFKASQGWLKNFKKRNLIIKKVACGESAEMSENDCELWRHKVLTPLLQEYEHNNIFNVAETGLFFKCLPDKILTFLNKKCYDGKRSKERVTLMVGANMTGTEKLELLLIGKCKKPKCFSGVKFLPLTYKSNTKSWITASLYEEWLYKLDEKFEQQNRKVLLLVDNCPAHSKVLSKELKSIKVVFLPPNMTSKLQPMDQGIINNLKTNYRKRIIQEILRYLDNEQLPYITLLDCVNQIANAWAEVKPTTIKNCFKNAGFFLNGQKEYKDEVCELEDDLSLAMWATLQNKWNLPETFTFDQYVNVDKDLKVAEMPSDETIISKLIEENKKNSERDRDVTVNIPTTTQVPTDILSTQSNTENRDIQIHDDSSIKIETTELVVPKEEVDLIENSTSTIVRESQISNNTSNPIIFQTLTDPTVHNSKKRTIDNVEKERRMDEAYNYMKSMRAKPAEDACSLFTELLCQKLRALDDVMREIAMHEIDCIMFRFKQQQHSLSYGGYLQHGAPQHSSLHSQSSPRSPPSYSLSSQSSVGDPPSPQSNSKPDPILVRAPHSSSQPSSALRFPRSELDIKNFSEVSLESLLQQ